MRPLPQIRPRAAGFCLQPSIRLAVPVAVALALGAGLGACATKAPPPPPPGPEAEPEILPPAALRSSNPLAEGIDLAALDRLVTRAERTKTSALVVMRNGKLVGTWSFDGHDVDKPLETTSITKSIVSIAIAILVDDGTLSYKDRLEKFFPELKGSGLGRIDLKHILTETSGIPAAPLSKVYRAKDVVKLALAKAAKHRPGHHWESNYSAVNLLPEVVLRVTGKTIDHFLDRRLFLPLGIEKGAWGADSSGHRYGMANLELSAVSLSKIGWMMAQGGVYQDRRILSTDAVRQMVRPLRKVPEQAQMWRVSYPEMQRQVTAAGVTALEDAGLEEEIVEALRDLQEDPVPIAEFEGVLETHLGNNVARYRQFKRRQGIETETGSLGRPRGFHASGFFGQALLVFPARRLVVVRQRAVANGRKNSRRSEMRDLVPLAHRLVAR